MTDGSYVLVGYPQGGPAALVMRDDAGPLRQALDVAFGSPTEEMSSGGNGNGPSTGTTVPRNKASHTQRVQS